MFGNSVGNGFATAIVLALVWIALIFAAMTTMHDGSVAVRGFWGIGLFQLLYVIPLYIRWKDIKPASAKGLVIGASVVALLNASCWGAFFLIFPR
jgi:hypothetical protein